MQLLGLKCGTTRLEALWSPPPPLPTGLFYIGSNDHNVYALNASTGEKMWSYMSGGFVESCPAVANGIVYIGSWDHNVYALNAKTGVKAWSYETGNVVLSPTVANGIVYVGSMDHNVYALNEKTGAKIWNYTTEDVVHSSPTVAKGIVLLAVMTVTSMLSMRLPGRRCGITRPLVLRGRPPPSPTVVCVMNMRLGQNDNVYALDSMTDSILRTSSTFWWSL
ncbi:MAG TPA: PQQ-binding-like beta-propeller repeat protein [Candidatus Acidoferrales bacterium]|nr:PQQ-binding-like beta-propeller repeat protein [Candidatus Acidoferrales bacterium]